jgi:hypothetical protein
VHYRSWSCVSLVVQRRAVILATDRADATGMLAGAQEVFGPRLFVCQSPATVAGGTIPFPHRLRPASLGRHG